MVKELLQLLITKVDANLFECVKFENFKSSDVEDADEVHFLGSLNCVIWIMYVIYIEDMDNYFTIVYLHGLIDEGTVAEIDKPEEEPVVHCQNTASYGQKNRKKWLKLPVVHGPRQGSHGVEAVVSVLTLVHPLSSDLNNLI